MNNPEFHSKCPLSSISQYYPKIQKKEDIGIVTVVREYNKLKWFPIKVTRKYMYLGPTFAVYSWVCVHWSVVDLPMTISLRKTNSSAPHRYQLPIALQLRVGICDHSHVCTDILSGFC